jgi:hypothetical protein
MSGNFSQAAKVFFTPGTFFPFLLGSACLSVIGNALTTLILSNWLHGTSWAAAGIILAAVLILWFSVRLFARGLSRLRPDAGELKQRRPAPRRGLILLVSRHDTCRKAIEYHLPLLERCWLICSAKSYETAEELRREFASKVQIPEPILIKDVNNPLEYSECVKEIYEQLSEGWQDDDVIADYTGMTAHGSVGMALACLTPTRPLEYTPGRYDDRLNVIEPLDPIEIVLQEPRIKSMQESKKSTVASDGNEF